MKLRNLGEPLFMTSSVGQVAYLLWHDIKPDDLTLPPDIACIYRTNGVNWGEIMNSYWMGEKIPSCEMSECIVVANRILKEGDIMREWFKELREALDDIREDYVFPVFN